jgi:hypothetical protein
VSGRIQVVFRPVHDHLRFIDRRGMLYLSENDQALAKAFCYNWHKQFWLWYGVWAKAITSCTDYLNIAFVFTTCLERLQRPPNLTHHALLNAPPLKVYATTIMTGGRPSHKGQSSSSSPSSDPSSSPIRPATCALRLRFLLPFLVDACFTCPFGRRW